MDSLILASYVLKNGKREDPTRALDQAARSGKRELLSVTASFAAIGLAALVLDLVAH